MDALIQDALHDVNVIRVNQLGKRSLRSMPRARATRSSGGNACTCPISVALGVGTIAGPCAWYADDARGAHRQGMTTPAMRRFMYAYDAGDLPHYKP